jgi:hypothetical protein
VSLKWHTPSYASCGQQVHMHSCFSFGDSMAEVLFFAKNTRVTPLPLHAWPASCTQMLF